MVEVWYRHHVRDIYSDCVFRLLRVDRRLRSGLSEEVLVLGLILVLYFCS